MNIEGQLCQHRGLIPWPESLSSGYAAICNRQKEQRHFLPFSYTTVGKNNIARKCYRGKTTEYMYRVGGTVLLGAGSV